MPTSLPRRSPADDRDDVECSAFNAAFYELGLRWHWDGETYASLSASPCDRARLRGYLEGEQAHLLRAYDVEALTDTILAVKQRFQRAFAKCSPAAIPHFNWADARWGEVGV